MSWQKISGIGQSLGESTIKIKAFLIGSEKAGKFTQETNLALFGLISVSHRTCTRLPIEIYLPFNHLKVRRYPKGGASRAEHT